MPTVDEVIAKYVELRDRQAELKKRQAEEMKPVGQAMEDIENWLLHQLNTMGVDSVKSSHGTAYRATTYSTQLQDAQAFKSFVLEPVVKNLIQYLQDAGYELRDADYGPIGNIIRDMPKWDMVDFRAGKKGVIEYLEATKETVPGVAVNSISTVNVRRS